jgi:hypothetical protein
MWADVHAVTAYRTQGSIQVNLAGKIIRYGQSMNGADILQAYAAAVTSVRPVEKLDFAGLGLGICAPVTSQRTSLEEHCRPNPRTVVNGEALYVEYQPGSLFRVRVLFWQ